MRSQDTDKARASLSMDMLAVRLQVKWIFARGVAFSGEKQADTLPWSRMEAALRNPAFVNEVQSPQNCPRIPWTRLWTGDGRSLQSVAWRGWRPDACSTGTPESSLCESCEHDGDAVPPASHGRFHARPDPGVRSLEPAPSQPGQLRIAPARELEATPLRSDCSLACAMACMGFRPWNSSVSCARVSLGAPPSRSGLFNAVRPDTDAAALGATIR